MNILKERIFNINSDEEFNTLCMHLFDLQIKKNPVYSSYSKLISKKSPNNINEIPFLPIEFFKTEQIICNGQKIEKIFLSSGTTGNQSKHLISDLRIYKNLISKMNFGNLYKFILKYNFLM